MAKNDIIAKYMKSINSNAGGANSSQMNHYKNQTLSSATRDPAQNQGISQAAQQQRYSQNNSQLMSGGQQQQPTSGPQTGMMSQYNNFVRGSNLAKNSSTTGHSRN